jgi:endonuclease VIII
MPEGDTIFRAAHTLSQALQGQTVTAFASRVGQVRARVPSRLVGQRIDAVEARGKHLLIWFAPSDLALHTHMRMNGSWHLYRSGERWRKAEHLARAVIDVDGWQAVCFSAPVCQLLSRREVEQHPSISGLGPDALDEHTDLSEARRRLDARGDWTIAEALLDQRVLAGVGNVYKCEVLFIHRIDPWTPVAEIAPNLRDELLATSERLLKANVAPGSPPRRTTTAPDEGAGNLYVYGRARRPCPRCTTPISRARQGEQARPTYWCRRCQGPGPARQASA